MARRPSMESMSAIDWDFIARLEGRRLKGYVPSKSSGVTVATGVDLGQRAARDIARFDLPEALTAKLSPYAGATGPAAEALLRRRPLRLTRAEASALDRAVRADILGKLRANYNAARRRLGLAGRFADIIPAARTVIASVAFQYGPGLGRRTPKFWACVTTEDWPGTIAELRAFGDRYPTRRNKEADLLASAIA